MENYLRGDRLENGEDGFDLSLTYRLNDLGENGVAFLVPV